MIKDFNLFITELVNESVRVLWRKRKIGADSDYTNDETGYDVTQTRLYNKITLGCPSGTFLKPIPVVLLLLTYLLCTANIERN